MTNVVSADIGAVACDDVLVDARDDHHHNHRHHQNQNEDQELSKKKLFHQLHFLVLYAEEVLGQLITANGGITFFKKDIETRPNIRPIVRYAVVAPFPVQHTPIVAHVLRPGGDCRFLFFFGVY